MSHADRILIHSFSGFFPCQPLASGIWWRLDEHFFAEDDHPNTNWPVRGTFHHIPKNGLTLRKGGLCIPMWVVGWLYIIPFVRFCWLNHVKSSGFGDQNRYLLLAYDIWIYLVFSNVPLLFLVTKHAESEYSCRNTVRCRNTKTSFCAYGDACQRSIWSWVPCDEVILVMGDVCGHPKPQRCRCAKMIKNV